MKTNTLKGLLIHLFIIIALGIIILLVFFYGYLPSNTNHGETITVPDLYETNMSDLEENLLTRKLNYEVSDSVYNANLPPLTITNQYPPAGSKVKEGRKIFLTVNRTAPPMITLPEISSKSIRNIRIVFDNLGIKINEIIPRDGPNKGLVLAVKYKDRPLEDFDRIPKGSSVDVVVSTGSDDGDVFLPDLYAQPYDEAYIVIKGSNLNLEPINIAPGIDTTGQVLYVIHQKPLPRSKVRIGEYITLWLDIELDSTYYRQRPDSLRADITLDTTMVDEELDLNN